MRRFESAHTAARALALVAICLLAACGGGSPSDVGDQGRGAAPTAVITVVGHPYQAGGATVRMNARSQSEITLSAKDSVPGDAPIMDFTFTQIDSHARIPLLVRTRNSVSFTTPALDEDTTYTFRLTVQDANGFSDDAEIRIDVKPIPDPNRFFTYAPVPSTFTVVVTPSTDVAADAGAASDATLGEFTIRARRLLTYRDRSGVLRSDVPLDVAPNPAPVEVHGAWLARTGAKASCLDAPENPRFELEIPSLDHEDLNVLVQANRQQQIELADIDEASLRLEISVESSSGTLTPQLCVLNPNAAAAPLVEAATTATLDVQQLRGLPSDALDTRASALAYYRALGEENAKMTFFEWLEANGFDRSAPNYGADAHAVYTNNFDLGFGRDMYVKVGNCDTPMLAIGSCDIASVVINYASLEAAAKKVGPILAVAMEYSATPTSGGRRFVKFYAYAPDPRSTTGDFKRVHSVNLDGRGEKYIPESCTVCHGGTPGGLDGNGMYANGGDVNATFLPWDLDALLFGDTDPAFSRAPQDEALRASLTRAAQEAELRKLNAAAYLTYADASRYALVRELIEGWYSAGALPVTRLDQVLSGEHDGTFVPPGWQPTGIDGIAASAMPGEGNDDNPADAPTIYREVFGPYCRSCHTVHLPNPVVDDVRTSELCDNDRPEDEPSPGAGRQRPMACYWQMVGDAQFGPRLAAGTMPLSRLTMDRFWIGAEHGATPASELLNEHLATVFGASARIPTPGTPAAEIAVQFASPTGLAEAEGDADIDHFVQLGARNTRFVRSYDWRAWRCTQPDDPQTCTEAVVVANANAANATIRVERTGAYRVELRANGASDPLAESAFSVAERSPALAATSVNKDFSVGASTPLSDLLVSLGNGTAQQHRLSIAPGSSQLVVEPASCLAPSSCEATTPIVLSSSTLTPLSSQVTVAVRDLNDANPVEATYPVSVLSTITAGDRTLCTFANSTGANLTSDLTDCANKVGFGETIDILELNSPAYGARNDLGIEFVNGTALSLRNFDNNTGVLTPVASGDPSRVRLVSYTPPLRLATHTRTGAPGLLVSGQPVFDEVEYRILRFDEDDTVVEESNIATLRFQINANTSFAADVMPTFTIQNCALAGCHNGAAPNRPDYAQPAEHVYAIFRGANGSYNTMINLVGGQPRAYVIPAEDPAALLESGLLCWPSNVCSGGFHTGGTFTAEQLQAIRRWIEDGANGF